VDLDENLCDSIKNLADKNNYAISSALLAFAMGYCFKNMINFK